MHLDSRLLRALEGIKDQLQSLSERSSAAEYQDNEKDMQAVCGLAEDARDAVVEYQVSPIFLSPTGWPAEAVCSFTNKRRCTTRTVN